MQIPLQISFENAEPSEAVRAAIGHEVGVFPNVMTISDAIDVSAKVANKDTQTVVSALIKQAKTRPNELYKSLTWDRGKELDVGDQHRRLLLRSAKSVAAWLQ
jgi:hypothetical protein